MIICLVCGNTNPPDATECNGCGTNLSRMDQASSPPKTAGARVTQRFDMFKEICQHVKLGEISSEEFGAWLSQHYAVMKERAEAYVAYMEESGYYEYQTEEVELSFEGIGDYDEGVSELFAFVSDGELTHIDLALELIWQGNEKINEAMRVNRDFRKGLEEEFGFV